MIFDVRDLFAREGDEFALFLPVSNLLFFSALRLRQLNAPSFSQLLPFVPEFFALVTS